MRKLHKPHLLTIALWAVILCSFITLNSCNSSDESLQVQDDFADFYEQFLSDPEFQLAHITFPLEGIPSGAETRADLEGFFWQKEDWQVHKPYDPRKTGFETEFVRLSDGLMVERITHKDGGYGMMRRFARLGGDWYLIYYAGLNEI